MLFQQYEGFQAIHVTQSLTPNADSTEVKLAQVLFETTELVTAAKKTLDGFSLKKRCNMSVAYI
ncbi:hypothetical protein ARMGADRAFT_1113273 [Armillaria gallica]|uniref:Uncharacterized protein n=1 Tax=Armillaria gallica TaxID=47427 RepID=A0A2H3D2G1_ARMGA|nr:hypothetical protein ARMGADRAFT_1113273 [Armillaria gallica]